MSRATIKKQTGPDFVDKAAQLPLVTKILCFIGLGVVGGILFYVLVYTPYDQKRNELVSATSSLQRNIAAERNKLRNHEAVNVYQEGIDTAYQYFRNFLPQENEIPRMVQMVSDIGAQAGLTDGVTLFAPKLPAQIKKNYAEIPFTMNLEGEFLTVLKFLYDFSRMDRIINVTEVNIGAPKMIDPIREIFHINVKSSGSTYRSLTEAEIAAQAGGKS